MFGKGDSTQYGFLSTLKKLRSSFAQEKSFGVLLTDLSKAFDCHSLKILLAKLHVYVFSLAALILLQSYLTSRNKGQKYSQSWLMEGNPFWRPTKILITKPLLFSSVTFYLFCKKQNLKLRRC